jgi:hypothetical protein
VKLTKEHVLSWINRNFGANKIRKGGQEIVMANPWGDSGQHFNISLTEVTSKSGRKGFFVHDWRPGHQQHDGSFLRFVQEYKNCSFVEAFKDVCGKNADPRAYLRAIKERQQEKDQELPEETEIILPPGSKRIDEPSDAMARELAVNYLNSRAVSIDDAKQHFVHYNSVSIVFPYVEFGVVVYWQSRSMVGKVFEFPPSEIGVTKSEFLYGFDQVEPGGNIIIVESIIDSINIGPGAVAMGGAQLSEKQVKKIRVLNPHEIILGADNDKPDEKGIRPGTASVWYNYNLLKPYFQNVYYCIPNDPYKDWNDMKVAGIHPSEYIEANKKLATLKSMITLRNIQ